MAQKYRKIDPRFWSDEKVQELGEGLDAPAEALALAVYMFSGPQTNRIGLYHFLPGMAAELCKIPLGRFSMVMEHVLSTLGWHFYERRRVLWLPHWWRYNEPENPKVVIGSLDDLHDVPITPLDLRFFCYQGDLTARRWRDGSSAGDTFIRTYRRKYPERIRIATATYPECQDFRLPEVPRGREDEASASPPAPSTAAQASAFEERIQAMQRAKRLRGKDRKMAETLLLAEDWNSLEDLLLGIEPREN